MTECTNTTVPSDLYTVSENIIEDIFAFTNDFWVTNGVQPLQPDALKVQPLQPSTLKTRNNSYDLDSLSSPDSMLSNRSDLIQILLECN